MVVESVRPLTAGVPVSIFTVTVLNEAQLTLGSLLTRNLSSSVSAQSVAKKWSLYRPSVNGAPVLVSTGTFVEPVLNTPPGAFGQAELPPTPPGLNSVMSPATGKVVSGTLTFAFVVPNVTLSIGAALNPLVSSSGPLAGDAENFTFTVALFCQPKGFCDVTTGTVEGNGIFNTGMNVELVPRGVLP